MKMRSVQRFFSRSLEISLLWIYYLLYMDYGFVLKAGFLGFV